MLKQFRPSNERGMSRRTFLSASLIGVAAVPANLLVTQAVHAAERTAAALSPQQAFKEIRSDEDAHAAFLVKTLGNAARPKPTFKNLQQQNADTFIQLSQSFENLGVGAYLMAVPAISNKNTLASVGSILPVEARHAGYLNALRGVPLVPDGAFDKPIPQEQIVKDVMPYIANLNGGPDPAKPLQNDTDILNFVLLLEYLESSFYDINVPKFYGG